MFILSAPPSHPISWLSAHRFGRLLANPRALLVAMPLLALPVRWLLVLHNLYPGAHDVFEVGFGFGDYVRSLLLHGEFRSCRTLPFLPSVPDLCVTATRMPVLPLLYAALAALVGTGTAAVAAAKCVLMAGLASAVLYASTRDARPSLIGVALLYALYFGPQPLKHGATLEYEEGILVDLSLALAACVCHLLATRAPGGAQRSSGIAVAAVVLAVVMYFSKTTALLTLLVVFALTVSNADVSRRAKSVCVLAIIAPFLAWTWHVHATTGQWRSSSSWNGENLWRGYNPGAAAIYPEITLDRAFDSTRAVLQDGRVVALGDYSDTHRFAGEWAWNDYYAALAVGWIRANLAQALAFDLRKFWVAFFEIRHTPRFLSATDKTSQYSYATSLAMAAWMVLARTAFFAALWLCIGRALHAREWRYLWIPALLLAACAPYVAVFGWQRHMVPILLMGGVFWAFLVGPTSAVPRWNGLSHSAQNAAASST